MKRVGVVFPGRDPLQQGTWSGTPAGIISGLEEIGVAPIPIAVGPPPAVGALASNLVALRYLRPSTDVRAAVRQARSTARVSPSMAAVVTACTPPGFGEAEELDGIVQIGTGFTLRTDVPIVTFEDMTVAQNRQHPYEQYALLSERAIDARIRRQRAAYEQAVSCCTATEWAAASIVDDYAVPADKVHVVGLGFRPFAGEPRRDWSTPRFLFVGLDWRRKNGDAILRAFERLRNDHPDARLDLVGGHPPISLAGVHGHGVLHLDVEAERRIVERLFREATCFVMPSTLEAAGIVYLEAASAGLPVIGTTVGGADFLVGDGGIVVDPGDDDALLAAMHRLADPETAARLGAIGRARSAAFTWPGVARRLVAALDGEPPTPWWKPASSFETEAS